MTDKLEKLRSFDEADREILQSRPDVAALWDKTARRRAISSLLLKARYRAGLSQAQLAAHAGWDKSYVSRLEGHVDSFPDIETISRYMTACNATVGLMVVEVVDKMHTEIVDAIPLNSTKLGELVVAEAMAELHVKAGN